MAQHEERETQMDFKDLTPEEKAEIKAVRDGLRVTKVVSTRAVKTRNGDYFVGMSAAWDSIQEDAGGMGADLIDALSSGEMQIATSQNGMDRRRAKIAAFILGMEVDLQATAHALAGGAISEGDYNRATQAIKRNYTKLLAETVAAKVGNGEGR